MNTTPRLRKGGRIASSNLFLLVFVLHMVYFVCNSASELERWAVLSFWGFPALTCSCFSELVIFRNLLHIFSHVFGLSMFFFFFFFCMHHILG